ncbi:hypothetical protein VIGAN_05242600, partial [Vigna angularis var. angularis]
KTSVRRTHRALYSHEPKSLGDLSSPYVGGKGDTRTSVSAEIQHTIVSQYEHHRFDKNSKEMTERLLSKFYHHNHHPTSLSLLSFS